MKSTAAIRREINIRSEIDLPPRQALIRPATSHDVT
jgi:hypothetical protein